METVKTVWSWIVWAAQLVPALIRDFPVAASWLWLCSLLAVIVTMWG
jgi:hypothetical protein